MSPLEMKKLVRSCFDNAWLECVKSDDIEPDIELIAAYLDDDLDQDRESYLARHVAESPRAFELLTGLLESGQKLPQLHDASTPNAVLPTLEIEASKSESSRNHWKMFTAAAIVLSAGLGGANIATNYQNATLVKSNNRLNEQLQKNEATKIQVLTTEKLHLARDTVTQRQLFLGGKSSARLVALAVNTIGTTRGGQDATPEEKLAISANFDSLQQAVAILDAGEQQLTSEVEKAVALVWTGQFDKANSLISQLEQQAPSDPTVLNVRGIWNASRSGDLLSDDAEQAIAAAETSFREAGEGGLPEAWINLALILQKLKRNTEAVAAARKYIRESDDAESAQMVLNWIGE